MAQRDIVFFSYNHNNSRWLAPIRTALEPYVLGQKLKVWSDRDIEVGSHWHDVIQNQLPRTRVAILLSLSTGWQTRNQYAPALQVLCEKALEHGERESLIPMRPALNPPGALVFTLAGHQGSVSGAAVLAGGSRALSWSVQ
jgi:hypothetical protein